jgi:hypothetical protein
MTNTTTEKRRHLTLPKVAECSMHAEWVCLTCKRKLWTERSIRSGGKEWLITDDGQRHFKSKCKVIPLKVSIDGRQKASGEGG